ncbi:hypothetical protein BGZ65_012955 [Modicella reniformis]|uniref:Up-regulated during septation protein 1 domain-containing protein n=1 Tax=Modicella reniformis TaxID=1440133 RepID=A0A9P6MAE8_9FUNG|nr:hypothetical protein BGZ65_012955 [Modicella reniformis]
MKQLEHQQDLFVKLDDQHQKAMTLSQVQEMNMDAVHDSDDAKTIAELSSFLSTIQQRLQSVLQRQQQQQQFKDAFEQKQDSSMTPAREDSVASGSPRPTTFPEMVVSSNPPTPPYFSMDTIGSTLNALESHVAESHQNIHVLKGELGLLRRQSLVLSASRNNSIKIKDFSAPQEGQPGGRIRLALEKSLKDALLAKEMAQQELENERQRWQKDQNHRINALEENLETVDDMDKKSSTKGTDSDTHEDLSKDEVVQELRRQLQEAIDEIDVLNHQQQSTLKSMRQLFDLLPDVRRKTHMKLLASHQQLQQQIAASPIASAIISRPASGRVSPSGSTASAMSSGVVGFSIEALIDRVKELMTRSEQMEQDNVELRLQAGHPNGQSGQANNQTSQSSTETSPELFKEQGQSTWIPKSELERLQATVDKVSLLENELDLLKQHTDVLMEENARLAELAAVHATSVLRDDSKELQEIIHLKDRLLRERDQLVEEQEKALQQAQSDLSVALASSSSGTGDTSSRDSSPLSSFDIAAMEDLRHKYKKLEGEAGEMRLVIATFESISGSPGSRSQLLQSLSIASNTPSPATSSCGSSLGGSLAQNHPVAKTTPEATTPTSSSEEVFNGSSNDNRDNLHPNDNTANNSNNAMVTIATATLRKEFRRAMAELRDEKDKAVRKEIEERRRLERELRQLRRELQATQISAHA